MKSGFTLIELLAVIVILAIIALIATPIVLNIINDTKESAVLRSAEFYLDAVKLGIAKYKLGNNELIDGIYIVNENGNLCKEIDGKICKNEISIDVNNEKPEIGSRIEIKNGMIIDESILLKLNNYSCFKENELKCLNGNIQIASSTENSLEVNTKNENKPIYNYLIYGNSIQNGVPALNAPVKIESVGEKTINLYGGTSEYILNTNTNDTHDTFYQAFEVGKTYTLLCYIDNTKGTGLSRIRMSIGNVPNEVNGWDYFPSNGIEAGSEGYSRVVITIPENYNGQLNMQYQVGGGTATFRDIMLVEGEYTLANLPDYEPYGKYKIPFKITRKGNNLFNPNDIEIEVGEIVEYNGVRCFKFYDINNSFVYNLSDVDTNSVFTFKLYREEGITNGCNILYTFENGTTSLDWYVPNQIYTVKFNKKLVKISSVANYNKPVYLDLSVTQLENGTEATEYEPYQENVYNIYIDEPLRKIGDIADYIDFANKKVVRNVEVIDETGALNLNESYKKSSIPKEFDIELPEIKLYDGINYLEIGTRIQPSKTIIKYYE